MGITGPTKTKQTLIDFKHAVLTGKFKLVSKVSKRKRDHGNEVGDFLGHPDRMLVR